MASLRNRLSDAFNHHKSGNLRQAERLYRQVLGAEPLNPDALHLLGLVAQQTGRSGLAAELIGKAIAVNPTAAGFQSNFANVLIEQGRFAEAAACCENALKLDPSLAPTHYNLGIALTKLERPDEALLAYQRAVALKPDYHQAHYNLGNIFLAKTRLTEALACFQTALTFDAANADIHNNLGTTLHGLGRGGEAIKAFAKAVEVNPDHRDARTNLALALGQNGAIGEARMHLEAVLAAHPNHPETYYNLGQYHRFSSADPRLARLLELSAAPAVYSPLPRIHLHFAAAKALDDVGRFDEAFAQLLAGNALKHHITPYDEAATLARINRLPGLVTADLLAAQANRGYDDRTPVFVVGMPRSGTTLVEQILSSHPDVHGAGELDLLDRAAVQVFGSEDDYLNALTQPGAIKWATVGERYATVLRQLAPQARVIIDKMTLNFRHVGLIRLILPQARIIHVRRNPVDTCLSCFSKLFTGQSLAQTYDLDQLSRYHRAYRTVMDHWRAVVPPSVLLDLDYEALVGDVSGQTRRLLDHCGLSWDPACLDFHRTRRPVRTASVAQVRQPLYQSSVGHWHAYPVAAQLAKVLQRDD